MIFQTVKDSNTGWTVSYMFIDDVVPEINIEGEQDGRAAGNSATITGRWSGWYGTSTGSITTPNGTSVWPVT